MPPKQRARNFGSNFTTFRYSGKNIAYLESVNDSGQKPKSAAEAIHPLGYRHPIEWVTSRAIDAGSLTLTIREIWHEEVWQQMAGLAGATDIIEVFEALARQTNYVTCTKIITPPDGNKYGKTYHRCIITGINDGESIDITKMSDVKTVTVGYTHVTRF